MADRKYSDDDLCSAVRESKSLSEVIRKLGLKQSGGTQANIKKRICDIGLDTSHFTGQLWAKGRTKVDDDRIRTRYDLTDIFSESSLAKNAILRKYIIKYNLLTYECSDCKLVEWNGTRLILELHHKNGSSSDNRLENLCWMCPNCHSVTPNYRSKNRKKQNHTFSDDELLSASKNSKNIKQICEKLQIRPDGDNYGSIRRRLRMLGSL